MLYFFLVLGFLLLSLVGYSTSRHFKPALWGTVAVVGLSFVSSVLAINSLTSETLLGIFSHPVFGSVVFSVDALSSWFLLIVGGLFAIGSLYGYHYLNHYKVSFKQSALHWLMFAVTLVGLLVLLTTSNMIVFLIGWEMMAIGSFFAVIFEYNHSHVLKAGLNYFIQSHVAVLLLTIVFAWAISVSGSTSFDGLRFFFANASLPQQMVAMLLLIVGFGFKAGIVPFHSWLPMAHPAAPSHISALMSGVIVKAGIYGIVRFGSMLSNPIIERPIGVVLILMGVVSGLYGIINAAEHRDFKRMLAYCTIENIGIICLGLGLGFIGLADHNILLMFLGYGGAFMHTLNHALFKSLLFFGAGNIYVSVHTRNMEELGGLGRIMPQTSLLFLFGCLAIGGLPPFGGFISELLIYLGFFNGFAYPSLAMSVLMVAACVALAVIGGVSMLAFTKTYGVVFLGNSRKSYKHELREVGAGMIWPGYAVVVIMLCILFFSGQIISTAYTITASLFDVSFDSVSASSLSGSISLVSTIGRLMFVLLLVVVLLLLLRSFVARSRNVAYGSTWGCGYGKDIDGIQYTGKSFAKTLIDMCKPILPSTTHFSSLTDQEVFPTDRAHISADADFVGSKLLEPGTKALNKGLNLFQFIQNGNLQRYIVYGLIYILLLIFSVFFFG